MKKNGPIIIYSLLASLFIGFGFLIGKMVAVPELTIDTKINPLHALSILVTLIVALVISLFFEREKEKNRVAISLIIKRIDKAAEMIDSLYLSVMENQIKQNSAYSLPKRIHNSLKCVWDMFGQYNMNVEVEFSELEVILREVKSLMTNTPINGGSSGEHPPIKVEDNNIIYSDARVAEIGIYIEKIQNKLYKTQHEVNRK